MNKDWFRFVSAVPAWLKWEGRLGTDVLVRRDEKSKGRSRPEKRKRYGALHPVLRGMARWDV